MTDSPARPVAGHLDVLCDVDGVLYPLPELFTPYAAERLGRDLSLDTTNWEFYTEWGLGYDDFVELLGEGVRERRLWWIGAPYPDVTPAIARIRAAGHRIHVVTARDVSGIEAEALDATRHWLDRHGIDADTITLAQDKTRVIERLGLEPAACVAIDDGPHHVEAFEAAGVFGIVLDRWGSYRGDHPMATDLSDVADMIEEWAAGA
jgi:phosphoglycolate phosphatase-like HAD superfamily hydrolase